MRQRFVEEKLGALDEYVRLGAQRKLTAKQEEHVIAIACTPAPGPHPLDAAAAGGQGSRDGLC